MQVSSNDQDLAIIFSPRPILRCKYKTTPQHIFKNEISMDYLIGYDKTEEEQTILYLIESI